MNDPEKLRPPCVTGFEMDLLLAADEADGPKTAFGLAAGTCNAPRLKRLQIYVKAGFLQADTQGRHTKYTITPAGRELADQLRRLEAAREVD